MTKFKTIIAGQIRAIEATEETRNEVKASLSQLRGLLPANISPETEPALLLVAGNLAVAGIVNKNDDGMDRDVALAVYKKFERQQINVEHDRKSVIGYIVHAGLSELGTDRLLTEDEAHSSDKPFNIAVVIALWRIVNQDLCNYIEEASSPTHPDFNALSLSFEVGFDGYHIVALPSETPNLADAKMTIRADEGQFTRYDGALRANKGSGLSPDDANLRVYRVIDDGIIPLGGGIVTMPAAAVKGLVAITQTPVEPVQPTKAEEEARVMTLALEEAKNTSTALVNVLEEKLARLINYAKTRVSSITPIDSSHMKLTDLQALKLKIAKASKIEDLPEVAASLDPIIDAIVAESEKQESARKAAENQAKELEAAKAQIQAAAEKAVQDVAALRKELDEIRTAQAAAAAEEAFQGRMTAIDETFELGDEERSLIVAEVKSLDASAFDQWMIKAKKLMKEKTKDFIKKKKDDDDKSSTDARAALALRLSDKGVKVSFDKDGAINEIIASAVATPTSSPAGSMIQSEQTGDIKELAKKALGGMTFGGKKK